MSQVIAYVNPSLPWDPLPGESRRFRILMATMMFLAVLIWVGVPFIKIPEVDRRQAEAVPEHLAQVVMKRKELPPPPPKPEKLEKAEVAETKVEKAVKEEVKAAPVETHEIDRTPPKAVVPDAKTVAARSKAKQALSDAGFDDLADLRDMTTVSQPRNIGLSGPAGNGTGGLITNTEAAGTSRNMITSRAGSGSGGLAAAGYSGQVSSGFGGGVAGGKASKGGADGFGLAGGKVSEVKSSIAKEGQSLAREKTADGKTKRSSEDIRRVFDQYAGRINNAYQRALRDDPTLQGTVSLKLTVSPDGSVSSVSVASSQISNPELEGRLLAIVRGMNFGTAEVESWTGTHNLNLFPN